MQLDSRIKTTILDISGKLGLGIALLDETGEVLASGDRRQQGTRDDMLTNLYFEEGKATCPENGCTYYLLENENYRPLRLRVAGISEEADHYCFLISACLNEILRTTLRKPGREEVFRRIMLERTEPLELQEAIRDYRLRTEDAWCVIIVQTFDGDASRVYDGLIKLFPRQQGDVVVNLNRYVVALAKHLDDETDVDSVVQLVTAMEETISSELSINACLGVGSVKRGLMNIRHSFKEAQEAINLGLTQQNQGHVFYFSRLLLERFLQDVPRDLRRRFYEVAYTDALKKVLNEEMVLTITKFFENNLNLSEAARKLYIHRNTLIYRLDKIQKVTGLDLRRFEDAVLLKIIIMLGKSLSTNNSLE